MQSHEVHRLFWHQLVEGLAWTTVAPVDVVERGEDRDLVPVKVQRPGPGGGLGLAGEFPRREGDDMVCAGSRLVGGAEREAEGGVSARARAGGCLVAALRTQREPQLPSEQRAPGQLRGWREIKLATFNYRGTTLVFQTLRNHNFIRETIY